MNLKTCYKILEIQETASLREIKQAYRDMIGIWHPDRYVQNPRLHEKATEKLKDLNIAYKELSTRLTSEVAMSDTKFSSAKGDAHLIIVTCPGCQEKNRIKAGFVLRHPRCRACGILLFQKKQPRRNSGNTTEKEHIRSQGEEATARRPGKNSFGGEASSRRTTAGLYPLPKRKRPFWNRWTLLLFAACIVVAIANAGDIRHKLSRLFTQITGGWHIDYFKDTSLKSQTKNSPEAMSAAILQVQQSLQKFGYHTGSLDGVWDDQTLAAVQTFRNDHFLTFKVDDVAEIVQALQRQQAIIKRHPDWPQIVKTDRFKLWIEQQIMTSPKICREILDVGKIKQVTSLLDGYTFSRSQPKPKPLPPSGALKKAYDKGLAPLTIQTRNDGRHYYLKLHSTANGSEILLAFIRGGSTFVEHVPVGKYEIKYAVGDVWYGTRWLFGPKTVYKKLDQVFDFKIQDNEIAGYRLDLYLQPLGRASERKEYVFDF